MPSVGTTKVLKKKAFVNCPTQEIIVHSILQLGHLADAFIQSDAQWFIRFQADRSSVG